MREYELLFIVAGDKTEPEAAKVADAVGAALLELGGKAKEQNSLGRRPLAYEIGKEDHGWYTLLHCEIEAKKANEFVRQLNVMDAVVRTVLLSTDEVPTPGEIHQVATAVEESKEEAKVKVPEAMRKSAAPAAKPAADTTTGTQEEQPAAKAPAKKASKKELEAALEEQLKD